MIKQMNGYKVLARDRYSARAKFWKSSLGNDFQKFKVHYPLNQKTFPIFEGSKLFFFKNFEGAEVFCGLGEIIVPCIAYNCQKIKRLPHILNFKRFWELKSRKKSTKIFNSSIPPNGTYVAESIKCLE
jgi:hypothetical protein